MNLAITGHTTVEIGNDFPTNVAGPLRVLVAEIERAEREHHRIHRCTAEERDRAYLMLRTLLAPILGRDNIDPMISHAELEKLVAEALEKILVHRTEVENLEAQCDLLQDQIDVATGLARRG